MRCRAVRVIAAVLVVAGLAGCGEDQATTGPSTTAVTEDTGIPVPALAALAFVVTDAAGAAVVSVDLAADGSGRVEGSFAGAAGLRAGALRGGKRSWLTGDQPVADVRLEDSGKLKVKDPSGITLWVVKPSSTDKAKVLQGEDVEVYSLQRRPGAPGEAKVKQGEDEIGTVRSRGSGGTKVERPDGTTAFQTDLAPGPGFGLLVMDRVPEPLRAVLLVELLQRPQP